MSRPTDIRAGRYAENEAAHRRINERIGKHEERDDHGEGDPMTFLCECAEGACIDHIPVTSTSTARFANTPAASSSPPTTTRPNSNTSSSATPPTGWVEKHADPEA